jgi:UDPglucose 6-dehydrogenase
MAVNSARPGAMLAKIRSLLPDLVGKTIAVMGLSFKPNTDDMREAPSIPILRSLHEAGALLRVYDPVAMNCAREAMADLELTFARDPYDAAIGADLVLLMTEWNVFRKLDLPRIKELMTQPRMVDCRNIYDPAAMADLGFAYLSVGRCPPPAAT